MGDEQNNGQLLQQRNTGLEINTDRQEQNTVNNAVPVMPVQSENAGQALNEKLQKNQIVISDEEMQNILNQLEQLDEHFSGLGMFKTTVNGVVGEYDENYVNRISYRNSLVHNMQNAIKFAKSDLKKGKVSESRWNNAKELLAEGNKLKTDISDEDNKFEAFTKPMECLEKMNEIMDTLEADSNSFTDSKYYKAVIKAIRNLKKGGVQQGGPREANPALAVVKSAIDAYIEKRSNGGTKTKFSTDKGERRMNLMRDFVNQYSTYDGYVSTEREKRQDSSFNPEGIERQSEKLKQPEVVNKVLNSEIQLEKNKDAYEDENTVITENVKEKEALKRFGEYDKQLEPLIKCIELSIVNKHLDFAYVKKHKEELLGYVAAFKDAEIVYNKIKEEDEESEIYKYSFSWLDRYSDMSRDYSKLEEYVNMCISSKQETNEIKELRKKLPYSDVSDENLKVRKELFDDYIERTKNYNKLLCMYYKAGVVKGDHWERFGAFMGKWKMNENGEPASEEDRKLYLRDKKFVNTLFNGTDEEYLEVCKEYYENVPEIPVNDKTLSDKYLKKHIVELQHKTAMHTNQENILSSRKLKEKFLELHPEYGNILGPNATAGDLELYFAVVKNFAASNGFEDDGSLVKYSPDEDINETKEEKRQIMKQYIGMIKGEM